MQEKLKKQRQKQRGGTSYSGSVGAKWFCCVFKVLSNWYVKRLSFWVEFRVSFINYFKRKRIIRVKACCGGV